MPKTFLEQNVSEANNERLEFIFQNFERIYLSFSAGKDSTVMLHTAADVARKYGKKIGLLLIDLEGQYKLTIEHALKMFDDYRDVIEPYWVALPIHLRNAVSVYSPFWQCWDPDKKEAWIRTPPEMAIVDQEYFDFFWRGMEFEEFVPAFGEWYSQGKATACLVGIRAEESLNRFRTIASNSKVKFQDKQWTTKVTDHVYNCYPIYDWKVGDIWHYHAINPERTYNRLYDYMYKAGLPLKNMRICQPYGDDQRKGLWLFHVIEPETWMRVVARVNGANGGALYINEWGNINGYRKVTKPEGLNWEAFAKVILESMPPKIKLHYKNKLWKFIKWWQARGYPEGLPDEIDYELETKRLAPSWRRVCKSLLRNDFWCKGLGFSQTKSSAYKRYLEFMRRKREQEILI